MGEPYSYRQLTTFRSDNPQNDVPEAEYPYSPGRLDHYLGWLAVRLSIRMQTAISPHRLFSFLGREIDRDQWSGAWWATVLARASLLPVRTALAGAAVAPPTAEAWQLVLVLGLGGMALCLAGAWAFWSADRVSSFRKKAKASLVGRLIDTELLKELAAVAVLVVVVGVTVFSGAVAGSIALSLALPGDIPAAAAGILTICLAAFVIVAISTLVGGQAGAANYLFISGNALLFIVLIFSRYVGTPHLGAYLFRQKH
jgi:uncharacterized membrane protein